MFALVLLLMILFSFCVSVYIVSLLMKERSERNFSTKTTGSIPSRRFPIKGTDKES